MESLFNRIHRSSQNEEGDAQAKLPERGESSSTIKASTAKTNPINDEQQYEIVNERLSYSNEKIHGDVKTADAVFSVQIPAFIASRGDSIGFHNDDESISTRASITSFHATQVPDDVLDSVPSSSDEDEPRFIETVRVETIHGENCDDEVAEAEDEDSVQLMALWQSTMQSVSASSSFQYHHQNQQVAASQPKVDFSEPSTTTPEATNNALASHQERQTHDSQRSVFYSFIVKILNIAAILVYVFLMMAFVCLVICTVTFCIHGRFSLSWQNPTLGKQSEPQVKPGIFMENHQDVIKSLPFRHAKDLKLEITTGKEKLDISKSIAKELEPPVMFNDENGYKYATVAVDGGASPLLMQQKPEIEELKYDLSNSSTVFQAGTPSLLNSGKATIVHSVTEPSNFLPTSMCLTAIDLVNYAAVVSLGLGHYILAGCITLLFFGVLAFLKRFISAASHDQSTPPVYMQCPSATVDDLCHFLCLCESGLSRTGRVSRASPSKSPLFGYNDAVYQTLTKEELHNIGTYLRVPLLHSADNKATLIQKIVPAYEAKLQGMLVPELKQVLLAKKISAAAWEKKTDLVRIAVEAGF